MGDSDLHHKGGGVGLFSVILRIKFFVKTLGKMLYRNRPESFNLRRVLQCGAYRKRLLFGKRCNLCLWWGVKIVSLGGYPVGGDTSRDMSRIWC